MKLPGKEHYIGYRSEEDRKASDRLCTIDELKEFAMEVAEYFAKEKNWGSSNPMNFNTRFENFWQELTK